MKRKIIQYLILTIFIIDQSYATEEGTLFLPSDNQEYNNSELPSSVFFDENQNGLSDTSPILYGPGGGPSTDPEDITTPPVGVVIVSDACIFVLFLVLVYGIILWKIHRKNRNILYK